MDKLDLKKDMFRSWFCVFNNPEQHGYLGTPQEICDNVVSDWVNGFPTRSCAVCYCVSVDGLKHLHVVLEDTKNMRFSAVKKAFPAMHIEPTRGSKEQAEDYINKKGKWQEKGEQIIATARFGEIKGCQGQRKDFEILEELIIAGYTPKQIFEQNFAFRRYDKMIRQAYFDKRKSETPIKRDVTVNWHVGESGSGKTYTYVQLVDKLGEDNVYLLNDYDRGGFDEYNGERILCMDEFRGQIRFSLLLNYLEGYKVQIPCRYTNSFALWNEVHIFTVLPPERVYKNMVTDDVDLDKLEQLMRRLTYVTYHYKENEEYKSIVLPISQYTNYNDLKKSVLSANKSDFIKVPENFKLPF